MMRNEPDGRVDLRALDPLADPARADALVRAVLERSSFELARRRRAAGELRATGSVLSILADWARPALAAAMLAAAVSVLALQLAGRQGPAEAGVIEALAVPTPVESWLVEDRAPATSDLILTLEGGSPW